MDGHRRPLCLRLTIGDSRLARYRLLFTTEQTLPVFPAIIDAPDGTHYLSGYLKCEYFDGLSAQLALGPFLCLGLLPANSVRQQRKPVPVQPLRSTADLQLTFVVARKDCPVL